MLSWDCLPGDWPVWNQGGVLNVLACTDNCRTLTRQISPASGSSSRLIITKRPNLTRLGSLSRLIITRSLQKLPHCKGKLRSKCCYIAKHGTEHPSEAHLQAPHSFIASRLAQYCDLGPSHRRQHGLRVYHTDWYSLSASWYSLSRLAKAAHRALDARYILLVDL